MDKEYKMKDKQSAGIQCILSLPRSRKSRSIWPYKRVKCFDEKHKFNSLKDSYISNNDRLTTFNLYMMRMKSMDKSRDVKVTIKCWSTIICLDK